MSKLIRIAVFNYTKDYSKFLERIKFTYKNYKIIFFYKEKNRGEKEYKYLQDKILNKLDVCVICELNENSFFINQINFLVIHQQNFLLSGFCFYSFKFLFINLWKQQGEFSPTSFSIAKFRFTNYLTTKNPHIPFTKCQAQTSPFFFTGGIKIAKQLGDYGRRNSRSGIVDINYIIFYAVNFLNLVTNRDNGFWVII